MKLNCAVKRSVLRYEAGVTAGFALTKMAGFTGLTGLAGTVALAAVRAASKAALAAALASLVVAASLAALAVARAASMVACVASADVWRAAAAALKASIWAWNAVRAATRSALVVSAANEAVVEVSAKPAISRAATAVRVFFIMSLSMCLGLMPLLTGT